MLKELKAKSLKKNLWLILMFLIIGLVFAAITLPSILTVLGGRQDLDNVDPETIHDQMYVDYTVCSILGWYAHTTKGSDEVSKEYVVPVGGHFFIGLYADKKNLDKCETLQNEFEMYLDGDTDELSNTFRVTGTILKMDDESLRFYKEYVGYDNMSASEQAYFLPYYLKINYYGSFDLSSLIFFFVFAVFFIALALFFLIRVLSGYYQKSIRQYCARGESLERVESFYRGSTPKYGLRIGNDYLIGQDANGVTAFVPVRDLMWTYTHVLRHKLYGVITTGKSIALRFYTRDGKYCSHAVKNEGQAQELLQEIQRLFPWVMTGYSNDLEKAFRKNREDFVREIDQRHNNTTTF